MKKLRPRLERTAELIAKGLTNKAIGEEMGVKEQCVKNNVRELAQNLGLPYREDGYAVRVLIARWYWENQNAPVRAKELGLL